MAMAITACSSNSMLCISSVSEKTEDEDDTGSSSDDDDDTDLDTFQYKSSQFQCCELTHVTSNIQNLANI